MKVLDLQCAQGHGFEGWFASGEEFETQSARGLVECPVCSDRAISKRLSAPRLNLGKSKPQAASEAPEAPSPDGADLALQAHWIRSVREVLSCTEDVGDRFADEARKIHQGQAAERGIRGHATPEQTQALLDEGIDVMPLLVPENLKETLQ
ncbi:MAG: DUF1178 family protein [Burkholderiaceae bacterium]|jgi:hypothetical protein|nr:DUF1178 family protein [Burkholderiaceae bacterium]